MKETKGEKLTERLFKERFKIDCVPIPREPNKKTADYFLKTDGKTIAVCEVEDIELQKPQEGDIVDEDGGFESLRDCNDVERIGRKVQIAYPQMEKYNEPKVLVIVDFDDISKPLPFLVAALTGKGGTRTIYRETRNSLLMYEDSSHVAKGKIKDFVKKIDLYIWINALQKGEPILLYAFDHNKNLCDFVWNRRVSKK